MEAAQNRPSFQTYLPNINQEGSTLQRQGSFSNSHSTQGNSQPSLDRRVSDPYSPDVVRRKKDLNAKRHSMLVESNVTKEAKELNRRSHDVTVVKNLSMGWHQSTRNNRLVHTHFRIVYLSHALSFRNFERERDSLGL